MRLFILTTWAAAMAWLLFLSPWTATAFTGTEKNELAALRDAGFKMEDAGEHLGAATENGSGRSAVDFDLRLAAEHLIDAVGALQNYSGFSQEQTFDESKVCTVRSVCVALAMDRVDDAINRIDDVVADLASETQADLVAAYADAQSAQSLLSGFDQTLTYIDYFPTGEMPAPRQFAIHGQFHLAEHTLRNGLRGAWQGFQFGMLGLTASQGTYSDVMLRILHRRIWGEVFWASWNLAAVSEQDMRDGLEPEMPDAQTLRMEALRPLYELKVANSVVPGPGASITFYFSKIMELIHEKCPETDANCISARGGATTFWSRVHAWNDRFTGVRVAIPTPTSRRCPFGNGVMDSVDVSNAMSTGFNQSFVAQGQQVVGCQDCLNPMYDTAGGTVPCTNPCPGWAGCRDLPPRCADGPGGCP